MEVYLKRLLFALLVIFYITPAYAMYYTTYIQGDTITYLPKVGEVVKKGETLIKFDTSDLELQIESLKFTLKEGRECLKDKKADFDRVKKLHKHKVVSTDTLENITCLYMRGKIFVKKTKLELEYYESLKKHYTVPAPYDCKVLKRIVCLGAGLKMGDPVMEIKKI
jgi:multidrug resistance efflux pump